MPRVQNWRGHWVVGVNSSWMRVSHGQAARRATGKSASRHTGSYVLSGSGKIRRGVEVQTNTVFWFWFCSEKLIVEPGGLWRNFQAQSSVSRTRTPGCKSHPCQHFLGQVPSLPGMDFMSRDSQSLIWDPEKRKAMSQVCHLLPLLYTQPLQWWPGQVTLCVAWTIIYTEVSEPWTLRNS